MSPQNRLHQIYTFLRKNLLLFVPLVLAFFLFGLLTFLSRLPQLVESLYTRHLYALITGILSPLSAALPFSLSEISLYIAILMGLCWAIFGVWRRRIVRTALQLLAGAAVLVLWFYLVWGLNYFRPRIEQQLHLAETKPDSLTLRENFLWCIENANASWQPIPPWNLKNLDTEIERSYSEAFTELGITRVAGHWPPKFLLVPALLDYTLTSGIFGPFFNEIHINAHLLPMELPFVLAHEKAHARGFARESEASFLAVLVCLRSPEPAVRYSAYFSLLGRFMARYYHFADADSLNRLVRPEIVADYDSVRLRIENYMGPIAKLAEKGYDFYLRANKVEGGVENYADVVDLVIRWRKAKMQETN